MAAAFKPNRKIDLDTRVTPDHSYAIGSMMGVPASMEDTHQCLVYKNFVYFGVFDGHGGAFCSRYCAENMHEHIVHQKLFDGDIIKAIEEGFLKTDNNLNEICEVQTVGTTALCAFIFPMHIYIANCGDSKAVLYQNGVLYATTQHKPNMPAEKERINNAGGIVSHCRVNWGYRSLGLSRALGDFELKHKAGLSQTQQILSPLPDIKKIPRTGKEEFLVLASDGVWDVYTNEALGQFIRNRLLITNDLGDVVTQVIDDCFYKGSRDNITIILICFPNCPQPTPEAIAARKVIEENIRKQLSGKLSRAVNIPSE